MTFEMLSGHEPKKEETSSSKSTLPYSSIVYLEETKPPQPDTRPRINIDLLQIPNFAPDASPALSNPLQMKRPSPPIQAKLTIGQPNDKYEQEANRVASQVVQQINAPPSPQPPQEQSVQRQEETDDERSGKLEASDIQSSHLSPELQRAAMPEEEYLQAKLIRQDREAIAGGEAPTDLASAIKSARGGGQPLEAGLQQSMGQAMGADFTGVRVHTDAQSDQLNQSIQAKAFTTGQDMFFRQGVYEPGSRKGQELIAHELTHVVQQNGEALRRSPSPQKPTPQDPATETPPASAREGGSTERGEMTGSRRGTREMGGKANWATHSPMETNAVHQLTGQPEVKGQAVQRTIKKGGEESNDTWVWSNDNTKAEEEFLKKIKFKCVGNKRTQVLDFVKTMMKDQQHYTQQEAQDMLEKKFKTKELKLKFVEGVENMEVENFNQLPRQQDQEENKITLVSSKKPSKKEIVANTHAFIFTNLSRQSLWKTPQVEQMKNAIIKGYLKKENKERTLPELLGMLKDPKKSLNRKLQSKKTFIKKWKREKNIFGEAARNRDSAGDEEQKKRANKMDRMGSLPGELVRVDSAEDLGKKVPRATRDPEKKKGATKYKQLNKLCFEEFNYDKYDYEAMKKTGMSVFNDPAGINFGAGTSGTIGDLLIEGRQLTKKMLKNEQKKELAKKGLDQTVFIKAKRKEKKDIKTAKKDEFMKEIATAAIAMVTNEGHHSLIECIVPIEKPLKLQLGNLPPEQILIQQIMPARIRKSFKNAYLEWAEIQIKEEALRKAVIARLKKYL